LSKVTDTRVRDGNLYPLYWDSPVDRWGDVSGGAVRALAAFVRAASGGRTVAAPRGPAVDAYDDNETRLRAMQRERSAILGVSAASYGLDGIWIWAFELTGAAPHGLAAAYVLPAWLICAGFYAVMRGGWNLGLADPNMTIPQLSIGYLLQLVFLYLAPQIGGLFLATMFVVAAFGTLTMTVRQFLAGWAAVSLTAGAVLFAVGDRLAFPVASIPQQAVLWLALASVMGRVSLISGRINRLRDRLRDRNQALRASVNEVERLANVDELTQTFNRRAILSLVAREHRNVSGSGGVFSVAMLDLDHFKAVNDRCGHLVGDRILSRFSRLLTAGLRDCDRLGRYGGEEFLVLLPGAGAGQAEAILERIRDMITAHRWSAIHPDARITVSAGVATFQHGDSVESLLARADAALYEAKRQGRNRVNVAASV